MKDIFTGTEHLIPLAATLLVIGCILVAGLVCSVYLYNNNKNETETDMGSLSKQKGKRGEQEVATLFRGAGFTDVRRSSQGAGGHQWPDVGAYVGGVPVIWGEVKLGKKPSWRGRSRKCCMTICEVRCPLRFAVMTEASGSP